MKTARQHMQNVHDSEKNLILAETSLDSAELNLQFMAVNGGEHEIRRAKTAYVEAEQRYLTARLALREAKIAQGRAIKASEPASADDAQDAGFQMTEADWKDDTAVRYWLGRQDRDQKAPAV